uniref:Uncharacterized protein n=1 Tax=Utricularia reniformis TaxID=192314 RepID=A0A1Y0B273_9LAMI|nr:hypothetical protein AEK19_MT1297 [Utricularia reniformis]ART31500.1 hypothetical protein AEK19_MT1297 [Utricularia reniformis]
MKSRMNRCLWFQYDVVKRSFHRCGMKRDSKESYIRS